MLVTAQDAAFITKHNMNIYKAISGWLSRRRGRRNAAREAMCDREATDRITLRDYGHDMYIAYDGKIIINVNDIKGDLFEVLDRSRGSYSHQLNERRKI